MRYAIYFTPGPDHPLTLAAQSWLGRNAFTGEPVDQPGGLATSDIMNITREPRRYGFHATLVAPFRLKEGFSKHDLIDALDIFADSRSSFTIAGLSLSRIGMFWALTDESCHEIEELASDAVNHFNPMRAPLTLAEIERRCPERLSERQRSYLDRYGYPFVLDEFRFHMTLTDALDEATSDRARIALDAHFAGCVGTPIPFDAISLFIEPSPGAPFLIHSIHRFGSARARRTA